MMHCTDSLYSDNENENCDECDIVAVTPQKVATKKIRKLKLSKLTSTNNDHQESQLLANEFRVIRNQYEFLRVDNVHMNQKYKLPFIFFDITEILKASALNEILTLNIKLVGIYQKTRFGINYLTEFMKNDPLIIPQRIKLNVNMVNTLPVINESVEMYGFLNFERENSLTFNVKFWFKTDTNIHKYRSSLQWQRGFIPWNYDKMNNYIEDHIQNYSSIINKTTSHLYEEVDESLLNKKTAELEDICFEMQQIMNIDEDVFL